MFTSTKARRSFAAWLATAGMAATALAAPVGTSFTYQGLLENAGTKVTSSVNLEFRLFDDEVGGAQTGGLIAQTLTPDEGVFSTTLDFGPAVFAPNQARWLEITVDGQVLDRQKLESTPFSLNTRGLTVGTNGDASVAGRFTVGGRELFFPDFWDIGAEANSFFAINETNVAPRLAIAQGGNVGIGTTSPDAQLEVETNVANDGVARFVNSNNAGFSGIYFDDQAGQLAGWIGHVNPASAFAVPDTMQIGSTFGDLIFSVRPDIFAEEQMRIAANGNVGIGTSSPPWNLSLEDANNPTFYMRDTTEPVGFRFTTGVAGLRLAVADGLTTIENVMDVQPDGDVHVYSGNNVGIGVSDPATKLHLNDGSLWINGTDSGNLAPSAGQGLRIWNETALDLPVIQSFDYSSGFGVGRDLLIQPDGGNVGIATLSPGFKLEVNGSAGKPGGGSWSNSSDRRLKKNIAHLDGALDTILALKGVTYEYNDPEAINELPGERIGFIAQDVEAVIPDWIDEGDNGYKRLTIRGFEALSVEAFREQQAQIDAHEDLIESMRTEIESLQAGATVFRSSLAWPVVIGGALFAGLAIARRRQPMA